MWSLSFLVIKVLQKSGLNNYKNVVIDAKRLNKTTCATYECCTCLFKHHKNIVSFHVEGYEKANHLCYSESILMSGCKKCIKI